MSAPPEATSSSLPWREALKVYLEPATLRMLALGFSAGLPLLLVLGTLSFRLREAGIDRTTIGYLSWVGLAYGFKWVWAPLVDRLPLPPLTTLLGRRRGWLLLSQAIVIARAGRHGGERSARGAGAAGVVRAAGGLRLGHAGHRARRLPHRVGRDPQAGRAGGGLPDRLPAGHDLGRCGRAVGRGLGRTGRREPATRTPPGRPPTW